MEKTAKFSKVSLTQFSNDWKSLYPDLSDVMIEEMYNSVKLPKRATAGSAGYDFFTPLPLLLLPDAEITIPT
ncbi:MAG: deoxyuridine 5'-triphosphate nucleotidohydrolase, partial [Clostridia bacterium]|nr:deoxyuridine 5'-triphosphate nucleotidohydrolase [Clostridia bacterium]